MPLVALLLARSQWTLLAQRRLTHAAGLAWLALCTGLFWQAMRGVSTPTVSAATVLAAVAGVAWLTCLVISTAEYIRHRNAIGERRVMTHQAPLT